VIHPHEGRRKGFWVEVPALPGCFTQGDTIELCMELAREAIAGYIESLAKLGERIPEEPERENAVIITVLVRLKVPA
jgi:predicted RNase H-like HicB family nuclease